MAAPVRICSPSSADGPVSGADKPDRRLRAGFAGEHKRCKGAERSDRKSHAAALILPLPAAWDLPAMPGKT